MIEMNKEYSYSDICNELGWEVLSGGNQRVKQIKAIESAFEFYHPENKKTHKPKKSYIFTKQLFEPELIDGRKNNGGNHNCGRKSLISDEIFDYLVLNMLDKNQDYSFDDYFYISNYKIYQSFGVDYIPIFNNIKPHKLDAKNKVLIEVFQYIFISVLRTMSVDKVLHKYGNEKGLIYGYKEYVMTCDEYMNVYKDMEQKYINDNDFRNLSDVIINQKYNELVADIQFLFEQDYDFESVRKVNKLLIQYSPIDIDADLVKRYQKEFWNIFKSNVRVAIERRLKNPYNYNSIKRLLDYEGYNLTNIQKCLDFYLEQIGEQHTTTELFNLDFDDLDDLPF